MKFIVAVRIADGVDVSFLKQFRLTPTLSQSWYSSPTVSSSFFYHFINIIVLKQNKKQRKRKTFSCFNQNIMILEAKILLKLFIEQRNSLSLFPGIEKHAFWVLSLCPPGIQERAGNQWLFPSVIWGPLVSTSWLAKTRGGVPLPRLLRHHSVLLALGLM